MKTVCLLVKIPSNSDSMVILKSWVIQLIASLESLCNQILLLSKQSMKALTSQVSTKSFMNKRKSAGIHLLVCVVSCLKLTLTSKRMASQKHKPKNACVKDSSSFRSSTQNKMRRILWQLWLSRICFCLITTTMLM